MFGLYLLDVCVSQLQLNKEVYTDSTGSTLLTKVVFINFPVTEVKERKRTSKEDDKIYVYDFEAGQSIQFSMTCEELLKKMKKCPLWIGVFRMDDNFPICSLRTHLSGCACDLGSLLIENPAPFRFRGPFDLIDTGQNFAGRLGLEITIFNLGRCLLMRYALAPNCFLFKMEPDGTEYKCNFKDSSKLGMSVLPADNFANREMIVDTSPAGNLIKDIAGISPVADHLGDGRPPPKPPRVPLFDPSQSKRKKKKKGKKKGKGKK
ncbi:uncharacterized protein LOC117601425 [Osmia lignaria lignaria]|uniref:uncharacterized protein LOC117601425 n=1 Tax=Osmia lignaria lignaria TaxID=1437193 RepID=UPI0014788C10|nr:uncharacterized protein LOC117601425 [Osmia lignaria]